MQETQVQFLGQEDPLEKEMATHSSILAWRIPWTEEPDRLCMVIGVTKVGHDLVTKPPPPYDRSGEDSGKTVSAFKKKSHGLLSE